MGTPEVSGPLVALGGGHVWLAGSRQGEGVWSPGQEHQGSEGSEGALHQQ